MTLTNVSPINSIKLNNNRHTKTVTCNKLLDQSCCLLLLAQNPAAPPRHKQCRDSHQDQRSTSNKCFHLDLHTCLRPLYFPIVNTCSFSSVTSPETKLNVNNSIFTFLKQLLHLLHSCTSPDASATNLPSH